MKFVSKDLALKLKEKGYNLTNQWTINFNN